VRFFFGIRSSFFRGPAEAIGIECGDFPEGLGMRVDLIRRIEQFLEGRDFGKNWDGAYQDAVPTLRQFFHKEGFRTHIMSEWDSPSRSTELVATKQSMVVRIPWAEDYNGRSLVDLNGLVIQSQRHHAAE
jgi:hypothetical protein